MNNNNKNRFSFKKSDNSSKIHGLLPYRRSPIEIESSEQYGYDNIEYNLAESSVPDLKMKDLNLDLQNLALSYGDHLGNPELRHYIAKDGKDLTPDQVLITSGASAALFIIASSLLKPGDHAVILHPNYVTNIETPRAIGCKLYYLKLSFEEKFRLDFEKLGAMIKPDTRLVSLTYPHNPTGTTINEADLNRVISLVESKGCYLLLDETYREMTFNTTMPIAATLSSNAISVSSCSKSFGLPGIRIGWLITQDETLMETFLAAKEQIFICNSVIDEEIAAHFMTKKEHIFPKIKEHIQTNFKTIKTWMEKNDYLEWVQPSGGCVCFPRIKSDIQVDLEKFYNLLIENHKTLVGPGYWFEMDRKFMRIGYGWPSKQELEGGLESITKAVQEAIT